jgi:hypothetical protein
LHSLIEEFLLRITVLPWDPDSAEIWFGILSRDVVRGGVWNSKKELVQNIMLYIKRYNEEGAAPFKWTYTGKPCAA